jgi:ATP-dependent Clp protease ATP-binding subunit ClpA
MLGPPAERYLPPKSGDPNINGPILICDEARYLLARSAQESLRLGHKSPSAAHVLMSIPRQPPTLAKYILTDLHIDVDVLRVAIEDSFTLSKGIGQEAESLSAVRGQSLLNAERLGCRFLSTENILLAALELAGPEVRRAFQTLGVSLEAAVSRAEEVIRIVNEDGILPRQAED